MQCNSSYIHVAYIILYVQHLTDLTQEIYGIYAVEHAVVSNLHHRTDR